MLKKKLVYVVILLLSLIFVLVKIPNARLGIKIQYKDITNGSGYLYYMTKEHPYFSDDFCVKADYDSKAKESIFWLDGSLAGNIVGMRMDFSNEEQLIGIQDISISSAGIIQKHIVPTVMFSPENIVFLNSIVTIDLIKSRNEAYILSDEDDPYVIFSDNLVELVQSGYSSYRLTRIFIVFYFAIIIFLYRKNLFDISAEVSENKRDSCSHYFENEFCALALLGIPLIYYTCNIVLYQIGGNLNDYNGHLYVYYPKFIGEGFIKGWQVVPYCMWHMTVLFLNRILNMPLPWAGGYASSIYLLFTYLVIYWMISRTTEHYGKEVNSTKAAIIASSLCVVQALYFPWVDVYGRFLGLYSINPLHNPTQMCVNGFSLLSLCLVYDIWGKQNDASYVGVFFSMKKKLVVYYIYLALILLASTFAKPTFVQMFVPAVGIIMLVELLKMIIKRDENVGTYFVKCVIMFLCAVPSLLHIIIQAVSFFFMGGSYVESGAPFITKLGEVWSLYSDNIVLSIAMSMAFPLFIILIDAKYFFSNKFGQLALVSYLSGLIQGLLLGEGGLKFSHSNFLWPMMSGMTLLWITATIRLLVIEKTVQNSKLKKGCIFIAWFIFFAHVLYGLQYIKELTGVLG